MSSIALYMALTPSFLAACPLTPSEQLWDHDGKNGDDNDMDIPVTPYEDMVENGRVRDTDGILSDGENPQK